MTQDIEVDNLEQIFMVRPPKIESAAVAALRTDDAASFSLSIQLLQLFILNRSNLTELDTSTSKLFSSLNYLLNSRFVNSLSNAISNISAHYDISNKMFEVRDSVSVSRASCAEWKPD